MRVFVTENGCWYGVACGHSLSCLHKPSNEGGFFAISGPEIVFWGFFTRGRLGLMTNINDLLSCVFLM